jgi:hypothetical protein
MTLLTEYALTPDVFDQSFYSSGEVADIHLQHLKEILLQEGLVRDLRAGDWLRLFSNNNRPWHKRGNELLKKLVTQKRLNQCEPALSTDPRRDEEWCREAIASNTDSPLNGIVSTPAIAESFRGEPLVAPINKLSSAPWWTGRSHSVRLTRNMTSYLDNLKLILQCSNSIMFIDPHLDPTKPGYRDFVRIILSIAGRSPVPLIEIHRACYFGSGRLRQLISNNEWEQHFRQSFAAPLRLPRLSVEVFIWDNLHDRYLISNLLGIQMGNGFDASRNPGDITTWTRLGRAQRDDIQREFDPASLRHTLKHRFRVP